MDAVPVLQDLKYTKEFQVESPTRHTSHAAGYDFYLPVDYKFPPGKIVTVNTGIIFDIPFDMCGFVMDKSSVATAYQLTIVGKRVMDFYYKGPILIRFLNNGTHEVQLKSKTKIAQIVFRTSLAPILQRTWKSLDHLPEEKTERLINTSSFSMLSNSEKNEPFIQNTTDWLAANHVLMYKTLIPEAKTPYRGNSAGYDLYLPENCKFAPGKQTIVNTGIVFLQPQGTAGFVMDLTSMMENHLYVETRTIDADYTGPIYVVLRNRGTKEVILKAKTPIAKIIFTPVWLPELKLEADFNRQTERGNRAFGGFEIPAIERITQKSNCKDSTYIN